MTALDMADALEEVTPGEGPRHVRTSHLQWVRISEILQPPQAKREYRPSKAAAIAAVFDLEKIGFPVLNHRDGCYWALDGNHRIGALRIIGFGEDTLQCEVYEDLTLREEAEMFLGRNTVTTMSALDKFKVGVYAHRPEETVIDRLVRAQDLHIAGHNRRGEGAISCVTTLRTIFRRQNAGGFSRTLRIAYEVYGDPGLVGPVLDGLSMFLHRYDSQVEDAALITRLANTAGGLNGLMIPAARFKTTLGRALPECVAASAAVIYNRGKGGKKLPAWWAE